MGCQTMTADIRAPWESSFSTDMGAGYHGSYQSHQALLPRLEMGTGQKSHGDGEGGVH